MTIEDVARRGGMRPAGTGWAPCPACEATRRGRTDKRGPVVLTECASGGNTPGEPAWVCRKCEEGGGLRDLAHRLNVELPSGPELPTRPEPPKPIGGTLDVEGAWGQLAARRGGPHRRAAVEWLADVRGVPLGLAETVADRVDGLVMLDGRARREDDRGGRLARMAPSGYDALIALRDVRGVVRSAVRRWTRLGSPPQGRSKSMQLGRDVRGEGWGTLTLGSLPRAAQVLRQGGEVWLCEGEIDWLLADAMASAVGGCAIAAPGKGQLPELAKLLNIAAREARVTPGAGIVLAIAHPEDKGREKMTTAARLALGSARVRLAVLEVAPEGKPIGVDLCDALRHRSADAVAEDVRDAPSVVSSQGIDLYRMTLAELHQVLYRCTLREAVEAAHWFIDHAALEKLRKAEIQAEKAKVGQALAVEAAIAAKQPADDPDRTDDERVPVRRGRVTPEADLYDLIIEWFKVHGGVFTRDAANRPYLYFERQLHRLESKAWEGRMYRLARLPAKSSLGAGVLATLQQWAHGEPIRPVEPWSWSTMTPNGPVIRWHLQGCRDRVLVIRPGVEPRTEANGHTVIQRAGSFTTHPVRYIKGVSAERVSALLWERIGRWLTIPHPLRLLAVAWELLTPIRHIKRYVPVKPLKWAIGPASNGKSDHLKLTCTLWYGDWTTQLMTEPTPAFLFETAGKEPYHALDNPETCDRSNELVQYWLTGSTGGTRFKRARDSDTDNVEQPLTAMQAVTSIEPPNRPELVTRTLLFPHSLDFGDAEYHQRDVIAEMQADRDVVLSGIFDLMAARILPRLAAGEGRVFTEQIGLRAVLGRQRITLGTIAVIADELCRGDSRWGAGGAAALADWLPGLEQQARSVMAATDPISASLETLRWTLNAAHKRDGEVGQIDDFEDRYRVRPLFRVQAPMAGGGVQWVVTKDPDGADYVEKFGARLPVVIGFSGSYEDLHASMVLASRESGDRGYAARIPSVAVLRGRWGNVQGWERPASTPARRGRGGDYLYDFHRSDMVGGPITGGEA